jgi:LPS O-antigen subunit length determinant protein (WzzB/FepE family)
MLANVQREYSYRFIDRAVPPDVRASPQRVLITALGALGGLVVSLVFVLVRNALRDARQ